jgi:hypothetical protein
MLHKLYATSFIQLVKRVFTKQVAPSRSEEHKSAVEICADNRISVGGSTTNTTARTVKYNGDFE